ncbi:hypothetical protein [Phenylobacterium sp.]|uniref:hypothetical protein n=1 Tax=Phenylobacterium sp. TaxID=1871053 RepID=UPI0035B2D002
MSFENEWARCSHWIAAALEHARGAYALEDVLEIVRLGDARFWAGRQAAMVTEIHEYPRVRALHFWLAGGDLAELRDHLRPMAEAWGRAQGCTRATIIGRKGWARALGYQEVATVCAKELS